MTVATPGRPARRWFGARTLRSRLVWTIVALLALGFVAVAVITLVVVHRVLLDRLDAQLRAAGNRFAVTLEHSDGDADNDPRRFGAVEGQAAGTLGARILNGQVTSAAVVGDHDASGTVTSADRAVLARLAVTASPRSVQLPHLGTYRLMVTAGRDGDLQVTGLPSGPLQETTDRLVLIEAVVFAVALVAVALASAGLVGLTLRPLRRVAGTASRIASLPLASGRVTLLDRAPPGPAGSEIDTLSSAFNAMLEQVEGALQQRHESEEQLRRFIADASHELRTPVTVVRSHAEYAQRVGGSALPEEVQRSLARITAQAQRMGQLVEDLLLLARLDSGRPLAAEHLDLSRTVLDAVDDARTSAPDHRWFLSQPDRPVLITGDGPALHQVTANLLANAATHTPPGTTVTTTIRSTAAGEDVEIVVEDDGPGIPPGVVDRAFDRFVRGEHTRSAAGGSSGLGLPIVAAIVTAHGGTVALETRPPGRGTRVVVRLPIAAADDGTSAALTAMRGSGEKIQGS